MAKVRTGSIASQLVRRIVLWLLLTWIVVLAAVYWHTRSHVYKLLDAHLQNSAMLVAKQPLEELDDHKHWRVEDDDVRDKRLQSIYQVWYKGELVARSQGAPTTPLSDFAHGFSDSYVNNAHWRVFTTNSVSDSDKSHRAVIIVAENFHIREDILRGTMRAPLIGAASLFPLIALLVWWSVRRALRPVREASQQIQARPAHSNEPLQLTQLPSEIAPLVNALNTLFERIHTMLDNERRFTADAAHELRTPIAAIRMMAQVAQGSATSQAREQALNGVVAGCDRAMRLIQQLLQLARLESESALQWQRCDIVPSLQAVVQELRDTLAQPNQQTIEVRATSPVEVDMVPALAGVMLRNLLENALHYSPAGSQVRVTIAQYGAGWQLQVEDSGAGMSDADMARLGERFFRVLGTQQPGSGLGWSIVQRIASLHRMQVQVDRSPELGGLRVQIASMA